MTGIEMIAAERQRQIECEGFDAAHDDKHGAAILSDAAFCYRDADGPSAILPPQWPWDCNRWKPRSRKQNLVRAGALYLAAADVAERAHDFVVRERMREAADTCALRLDSILV